METLSASANESTKTSAQDSALPAHVMAALGYFCGLAAILALVLDPYRTDRKARFHAIQSLLFCGTCMIGYMAVAIVLGVLGLMVKAILGSLGFYWGLSLFFGATSLLYGGMSLAMFAAWVYLIVRSAMGHKVTLPVIGPMAERMSSASAGSNA